MFPQSTDSLFARVNTLLGAAKGAGSVDQQTLAELQHLMNALIEATLGADDWLSVPGNGRAVESLLYLVDRMLEGRSSSPLCDCGVRSAVLVVQRMPADVAQVCSQGGDEASVLGLRIVDSCLSKLVDVCDETERKLSAFVATAADEHTSGAAENDVTDVLHAALASIEGLGACFERMSLGHDGLLNSPAIWKSVLEGTSALALYLVRSFECACKLFTHCNQAALKRRSRYAAVSNSLYKASGKLMDQVSAVFSAEAHLAADSGRKRSLLERFCGYALSAHKSIMNSPPQFKAVWKALCVIVTSFSAASFDGSGLCLKVYMQSCETVRTLATQAVSVLRRSSASDLGDQKLQRRLKGILAFVRFIVFQMSSLLARIQNSAVGANHAEVVSAAMPMLNTLLGELTAAQLLASMPKDVAAMIDHLVSTVSTKFTLSLFCAYPELIFGYLDRLQQHASGGDTVLNDQQHTPLLDRIQSPVANREIIRTVLLGVGSFTEQQQTQLFARNVPLLVAFSMAIDCDPASVFSVTKGCSWVHSEQQSATIEYEQLVCAAALSATKLATPAIFEHWETAALRAILQAPSGSLGAMVITDAWGLLVTKALLPAAAVSTVVGILDVVTSNPQFVSEAGRYHVKQLLGRLFPACQEDELSLCISSIHDHVNGQSDTATLELLCVVIPWNLSTPESAVLQTGRALLNASISLLGSRDTIADQAALFSGLAALLPSYQLDSRPIPSDEIWRYAYVIFEKALEQVDSADAGEWQRGIEAILQLAFVLSEGGYNRALELLELCGRNISNTMLQQDRSAFLLAQFAGSFAGFDLVSPSMESAVTALSRIFGCLLGESMPWIVRHQACLQVIRFATESVNQSIVEILIPDSVQEQLVKFIQRVPGGDAVDGAEQCESVYRQALSRHSWQLPSAEVQADAQHINGDSGNLEQLVGTIGLLQQQLETALRRPMPAGAHAAVEAELGRLVQTIERFSQG
ncbi:hypothetical protein IWW51_000979 [Coemansia sp. RSA 2702]|nr:hypothetical protein IWW51_000979 [Coemansia sp. RSA 2702]